MELDVTLPPDLVPVAWLLGRWAGVGVGGYPGSSEFRFGQEVTFGRPFDASSEEAATASHYPGDRPYLTYRSRSWLLDDAGVQTRPLAEETGYWRPLARTDGVAATPLEVLLVHPAGYVELWDGTVEGAKVELRTDLVARSPFARDYTAGHRLYGLVQGELMWAYDMAAGGRELTSHVSARLKRVG